MTPEPVSGAASAGPVFDALARLVRAATAVVLAALVVLVCSEVVLRGVANISLDIVEEMTGYFVVVLTFFGAALALRASALFQVNFIFRALPEGVRVWLFRLFVVVALAVCVVLAWRTGDLVASSLARGKFAPTVLRTPLWIPQLVMPAGFALIGVFLIEQLLLSGRRRRAGKD